MKKFLIIALVLVGCLAFTNMSAGEGSSKQKLLNSMTEKKSQIEKKIVELWMSGNRGKELELMVSEYVTLEVKHRAISNKNTNDSLLNKITKNEKSVKNYNELCSRIVLQYFKEQGIDLQGEQFIKGSYMIKCIR